MSFFPLSMVSDLKKPMPLAPKCGSCGLFRTCESPKMKPYGKGRKKILIIGEAPEELEDKKGIPFVGKTGTLLRNTLEKFNIDPDKDTIMTNALICRPENNRIKDRKSIEYCRPNIIKVMREYKPEIVILLGGIAVQSLIGYLWKEDTGGIMRWLGWKIPSQKFNSWICPTWHPSFVERLKEKSPVPLMMFEKHIKEAVELEGRPWKKVPDYKKDVELIFDSRKAKVAIRQIYMMGRDIAFDYETTSLKPEGKGCRIVACSISNGKRTIAFPWEGDALGAMTELLKSDLPKIGSNLKFEHRWTEEMLGIKVKNWKICTMTAAHVLDNRPSISSIKFQSFVLLGQESYDDHVKSYKKSKDGGGYGLNKMSELDLTDMLLYCGLDSLLEYWVARIQLKELKNASD